MRLRWECILGTILLGVFIYLFVKLRPLLHNLLKTANQDYGYENPVKVIMLAMLCLSLLGAVKLLMKR